MPVCQDYNQSLIKVLITTNAVTAIIVVINIVIKTKTIDLITWIGYDTHSEQLTKITNGVFIGQFFNTAILLLLVYANFSGSKFPGASLFNGPFYDYSDMWYAIVGSQIVKTMLIGAILPPIIEVIPIVMAWFFQRMDQGWVKGKNERLYSTKQT